LRKLPKNLSGIFLPHPVYCSYGISMAQMILINATAFFETVCVMQPANIAAFFCPITGRAY